MITLNQICTCYTDCRLVGEVPGQFSELVLEPQNAHEKAWLYIPATNPLYDGRLYIDDAVKLGAAAVVIDEAWYAAHPISSPAIVVKGDAYSLLVNAVRAHRAVISGDVFAVSGSVGKTTTRELLAAFLRGAASVCETLENGNSGGGQCETLLRSSASDKYVVSEVGICGPGQMKHSCRLLQPSVAVLTSIGTAHVGNFKDREQLAREKIRIFDKLWGERAFGVVSREMEYIEMARKFAKVPLVEVSLLDSTAHFYGVVEDVLIGRMSIYEKASGTKTHITIGRPGRHICADALLAFAAARSVGVTASQCVEGLKTLFVPGDRWKMTVVDGVTYINDTFNASPSSMKAVLALAKSMKGRVIAVLGDMLELGDQERDFHREVGETAADAFLDALVTYGPLSTSAMADAYDARRVKDKAYRAESIDDVKKILRLVAGSGDTVIFKASNGVRLNRAIPVQEN